MNDERDIFMLLAMRENILHTFFQVLWEKSRSRKTLSNVKIPDTVIFSHSRVADWFFTAKDGVIRKKGHTNLSSANVLEQFEKRAKKNKSTVVGVLLERDTSKRDSNDNLKRRHLDSSSIRQFLGEGGGSGTLQVFVEPKPESGAVRNNEIVLSWTPNVFYVEKKTNMCDMTKESKASLDERTTVEETAKNVNVAPLVSSRVASELEGICQEIALHMELVFAVRLASIELHAKVDAHDQLWIMFCSNLRVTSINGPPRGVSVSLQGLKLDKPSINSDDSSDKAKQHLKSDNSMTHPRSFSKPQQQQDKTSFNRSHSVSESVDTASSSDGESLCSSRRGGGSGQGATRVGSLRRDVSPDRRAGRRSPHIASPESDDDCCVCMICLEEMQDACRLVPKRHVLFPLSVIAFFSSHPPGSKFVDVVESARRPEKVPEFVTLLHPDISLAEFQELRRDPDWLGEPVQLCDKCADGLRDVVSSLKLERDGSIIVPRPQQVQQAHGATSGREPKLSAGKVRALKQSHTPDPISSRPPRPSGAASSRVE